MCFEKGVLVILGLGALSVNTSAEGGWGCVVVSDKESSLICIRAVEVPVKLVKCYCLGRVPSDFVYKHWAGCLEGKEVTALSEP